MVLEREGEGLGAHLAQEVSSLSSSCFLLVFAAIVSTFLHVLPLPPCILQALSEWEAYWVLGGVPFSEFALFKSGEHTCKVYAAEKGEDHHGSAAHPHLVIPPC
ncbi:unnamed protein product [Victoria cruziana]